MSRSFAVALLVTAALLGGCADLRVESGPPTTPSADETEQVRQREALATEALIAVVQRVAPVGDPVDAELASIGSAAKDQLEALGGVWVPFDTTTDSAEQPGTQGTGVDPDAQAEGTPTVTVAEVVALLADQADGARSDALTATDGRLARLVASIALHRSLSAAALATAADADPVDRDGADDAAPDSIPTGLSATALAPAIVSEDALGLLWEVVAARSADEARATALATAAAHREVAEAWARAAGVAGTAADPREVSYDLPDQLADPETDWTATLGTLEWDLTTVWVSLVGRASPGARADLFDAAAAAARNATTLTGTIPALPGTNE